MSHTEHYNQFHTDRRHQLTADGMDGQAWLFPLLALASWRTDTGPQAVPCRQAQSVDRNVDCKGDIAMYPFLPLDSWLADRDQ